MKEMDDLREAWRDLAFCIFRTIGITTLARRLGLTPKDWYREREQRGVQR